MFTSESMGNPGAVIFFLVSISKTDLSHISTLSPSQVHRFTQVFTSQVSALLQLIEHLRFIFPLSSH